MTESDESRTRQAEDSSCVFCLPISLLFLPLYNLLMGLCCQILTKDSVTVFVNGIMYFKVKNAIHAVANVDDFGGSARLLAATTLRNVLGTMTLGEILSTREKIATEMKVNHTHQKE